LKNPEISILRGSLFIVSDGYGDVGSDPAGVTGLYYRDTRHLSRWQLRVDHRRFDVLSAETLEHDEAIFFLMEPTRTIYRNPEVSVIRRRRVADSVHEHIEVCNHGTTPIELELTLTFDADFADLFAVKDKEGASPEGTTYRHREAASVTLGYHRGDFRRETHIHAPGAVVGYNSLTFPVTLAASEEWTTEIEMHVGMGQERTAHRRIQHPELSKTLDEWMTAAPRLETDWHDLAATYRRSMVDLAALRLYPESVPESSLPAAGLPWFMALFGRDSLLTSYQALPFAPELARTTLRALAAWQAEEYDDFRDADPGKILHELRHGERAHFQESPQSPYYGSADATPLFLVVLDEYERWTGDTATVRELEPAARAAVRWIGEHGDLDGDGFQEYQTRNPGTGLANQCWKDSWNAIAHPDGTLATLPRATCELQGYAYDALRRTARLAREVWRDSPYADRLDAAATRLRDRFNTDFWLPEEGTYALALDGDKQPVRTLSSNIGHLLWSGIVPPERAGDVAGHLLGDRLFSGWGVRTVGSEQPVYNPIEYHNGTVWPHDTALIAAGLARYGCRTEAVRLATALLDAAPHFGYRLPEAITGYRRATTRVPVMYPTACSPQAWAAGAPLLMTRLLLGMEPGPAGPELDPHLPAGVHRLALRGVPGRWDHADAVATA